MPQTVNRKMRQLYAIGKKKQINDVFYLEIPTVTTLISTHISKNYYCQLYPKVTKYMIDEARALAYYGDTYEQPRTYMGNSLDSDIVFKVKDYYLNDDFNISLVRVQIKVTQ